MYNYCSTPAAAITANTTTTTSFDFFWLTRQFFWSFTLSWFLVLVPQKVKTFSFRLVEVYDADL